VAQTASWFLQMATFHSSKGLTNWGFIFCDDTVALVTVKSIWSPQRSSVLESEAFSLLQVLPWPFHLDMSHM